MRRAMFFAALVSMTAMALAQDATTEQKLVEGKWVIESVEYDNGENEPRDNFEKVVVTFKGSVMTSTNVINGTEHTQDSTMTLDPTRNPKTIDLEQMGERARGIYRLQGEELLICINEGVVNESRPTEFKTTKDSGFQLWKLKRVKN